MVLGGQQPGSSSPPLAAQVGRQDPLLIVIAASHSLCSLIGHIIRQSWCSGAQVADSFKDSNPVLSSVLQSIASGSSSSSGGGSGSGNSGSRAIVGGDSSGSFAAFLKAGASSEARGGLPLISGTGGSSGGTSKPAGDIFGGGGGGSGLGNVLLGSGDSPLMDAVVAGVASAIQSEAKRSFEQAAGGTGPVASFVKQAVATGSIDQASEGVCGVGMDMYAASDS